MKKAIFSFLLLLLSLTACNARSEAPDAQQAASANASGLVYSGYVQAGKEALAIIGGLEYGVGDTLPNTGDVIRFIGSDGVRLYSPSRNAEWTLPYSGDDI